MGASHMVRSDGDPINSNPENWLCLETLCFATSFMLGLTSCERCCGWQDLCRLLILMLEGQHQNYYMPGRRYTLLPSCSTTMQRPLCPVQAVVELVV